jgi:hypothetical protein
MTGVNELLYILHSAISRENLLIVGDVISHVVHGRVVVRREPHDIDAQRMEIRDLLDDAGNITPAVTIRILE